MKNDNDIIAAAILLEAGRIANNIKNVVPNDDFTKAKLIDNGSIMLAVDEFNKVKEYLKNNATILK